MNEFKRSLGTLDATMIVAGSMIGSGVFIVSADIARQVQHPVLLLVVWGISGLLTLIAATAYGELAGMMPHAGGQYVYLRESFGRLAGFLYGWTLFTVIQTGTIAAVAMAFAKFTAVLLPQLAEDQYLFVIKGGLGDGFSPSVAQLVAIGVILVLTAINSMGVRLGKVVQNVFTTTKVLAVVLLAIGGLLFGTQLATNFAQPMPSFTISTLLPLIAAAMVGSLFSSDAWNNITFIAAEVKQPERTIPRSLGYGVLLVTLLYLTTNVSYLNVLPIGTLQDPASATIMHAAKDRVGTAVAEGLLGNAGAIAMAVLIMISTFGCNNGLILAGARAYWAMATDKLFFKGAATLNKHGVPSKGLWIQAVWASLLCLSGSYGQLLDYVVFAVLIFYVLTILGIFRLRKTQPNRTRPVRAFGYPVVPALYVLIASGICGVLLYAKPNYTWGGLIIVACGLPVYGLWQYINARRDRAR